MAQAGPNPIITKLALKGGGARGYVYPGVAKALEELGYLNTIDTISGSSAGAISALLLATGLSVDELTHIIDKADIKSMVYAEWPWEKAWDLIAKEGLHQGLGFVHWFGEIIEQVTGDKDTTFAQWHALKEAEPKKGMKDLIVEACNMDIRFNEIFSHETIYKDVPIRHAVRASMAFPEFFTPWKIRYVDPKSGQKETVLFQDGGLQSNCPIGVFNLGKNEANPEALAIWLATDDIIQFMEHGKPLPKRPPKHDYQLIEATVEANLNAQTYAIMESPYRNKTILVNTLDVGTLDFSIDDAKKQALSESGYQAVKAYFGAKVASEHVAAAKPPATIEADHDQEVDSLMGRFSNMVLTPVTHGAYSVATTVFYPITWAYRAVSGTASTGAAAPTTATSAVEGKPTKPATLS